MKRLLSTLFVCTVVAFGLSGVRRIIMPSPMDRCARFKFDQRKWIAASGTRAREDQRGCMIDDLLRRHDMKGWTRRDVVNLLGEPRPTEYFSNYDLVYRLGDERGFISIDSEWLVMKLDSTNRVSDIRLVTD